MKKKDMKKQKIDFGKMKGKQGFGHEGVKMSKKKGRY